MLGLERLHRTLALTTELAAPSQEPLSLVAPYPGLPGVGQAGSGQLEHRLSGLSEDPPSSPGTPSTPQGQARSLQQLEGTGPTASDSVSSVGASPGGQDVRHLGRVGSAAALSRAVGSAALLPAGSAPMVTGSAGAGCCAVPGLT
jgi:hypothetical protein